MTLPLKVLNVTIHEAYASKCLTPLSEILSFMYSNRQFFIQDTLEMCSREIEFKSILFSLVYFHAVVIERRKFGPQGWNRSYPFNTGDLTISVYVLFNYLEANAKVPWTDLRYLFGEIMYGGHITDDWDRRLCRTYLEEFMMSEQVSVIVPTIKNYNYY